MSCYTLDHIIRECMEEKGKSTARGKTQGAKNEIYHEAWRSLNMWIESRILKQKGASISGFGCFGWELKVKDGTTHSRPIFIISDLFVKNFKVKRDRVHQQPRLTSVEEVNHSLIAIKYSKVLTKDMVFSGLRDILKKLGDYVYRGYDVDVEFSFGTLFVREKRIKFEFDQTKLANNLAQVDIGIYAYDENLLQYIDSEGDIMTNRSSRGPTPRAATATRVPQLNLLQTSDAIEKDISARPCSGDVSSFTFTSAPQTEDNRNSIIITPSAIDGSATQGLGASDTFSYVPDSEQAREALPEDLRSLLETISKAASTTSKATVREQRKNRVAEQAIMRSLDNIEKAARLDDGTLAESENMQDEWRQKLLKTKVKQQQQKDEIMAALTKQMHLNQQMAADEELEKKSRVAAFILPANAGIPPIPVGFSSTDGTLPAVHVQKQQIKQIQEKSQALNQKKMEAMQKEKDYLRRLAMEIDMNNAVKRSEHLEVQRAMLESWERDGHFRNLKKLEPCGVDAVKEYVQRNMADLDMSTLPANATLGGALNMSIGYDPRKGRL